MRRISVLLFVSLTAFVTLQAVAQPASENERIRQLEEQLQQQQVLLRELQAELERLKADRSLAATPPPGGSAMSEEPLYGSEVDTRVTGVEVDSDDPAFRLQSMEMSGFAQLDMIYDFDRVAPGTEATLVPSTIPYTPGEFGDDGNYIFSIKQSRVALESSAETSLGDARAWIEYDLFGTGSDAGRNAFNLRHAWFELGRWGAGQTWSNFMDISTWPNVTDWWGPSAMVLNRNPQLRYTMPLGDDSLAIALEQQNGSFNVGVLEEVAPGLSDIIVAKTDAPDLTAHYRMERDWGHLQLAGVLRHLSLESRTTELAEADTESETGWGLHLSGILNTVGRDQLKFGVVHGEGIASFINDGGGSNIVPDISGGRLVAEPSPSTGYMLYYDHYWPGAWSSSIGYALNDIDTTILQSASEIERIHYASTNLLYTPTPWFMAGLEALWGKRDNVDGTSGEDFRLQFSMRYNFDHGF